MTMSDLYPMLEEGLSDFVFGVANVHKGRWTATALHEEPLIFNPRSAVWFEGPRSATGQLKEITAES